MDPALVNDRGTFEEPHQFPEGIPYVLVNGMVVIDNYKQKRKYPGKVLRHTV